MKADQGPISVKERAARYQQLIEGGGQSSSPPPKPPSNPKTVPPAPIVQPKPIITPNQNFSSNNSNSVESPTIVKPSAFKQTTNTSTNNITSTNPSLFNTSEQITTVTTNKIEKQAENKAAIEGRLSHQALKQLMEGKIQQFGMQPPPEAYGNKPKPEPTNMEAKQTPEVVTNPRSSVKDNILKLNQFFVGQIDRQANKTEVEEPQKQSEGIQRQTGNNQSPKIEFGQGSNTQNISGATDFYVPPELAQPNATGDGSGEGQAGNLVTRLKRKKMTKQEFSSDEN